MRSKFKWIFTLLLAFTMQFSFAQEKTVTGTVTDGKLPLSGANVKNGSRGVQTDADGKFAIKANVGDVLTITSIGFERQTIKVGSSNTYNFKMESTSKMLEDVVIAQNIKKSSKSLGFATVTLKADDLEGKPSADVVRNLQGKLSGVQITNVGGLAGQTSNFVIRGVKSFSGSSQPLFVIDGIPFDTSQSDLTGSFNQGASASTNRFLDLDPSNIETLSVLKGLAASVTYGERGKNGVVLITTKSGKKGKMTVELNNSLYISEVANLPKYTNMYGGGNNNIIGTGNIGNWGAPFDSNLLAPHIYDQPHLNSSFPEYVGVKTPWVAAENNVKDFFRKGYASQTSLSLRGGNEKSDYALNLSYTDENGIVANNFVNKYNFGGKYNIQFSEKLNVKSAFTFFNTKYATPPVSAANGAGAVSIFSRLLYLPRNYDIMNLPYEDPLTHASVYYRTDVENPRWLLNNSKNSQEVNRILARIEPSYEITNKLTATYRLGFDRYTDDQTFYMNKGAVTTPYNLGYLRTVSGTNTVLDQSLIFRHKTFKINENIGIEPMIGFNSRHDSYRQDGMSSQGQLVFGAIDHRYFSTNSNADPFVGNLYQPLTWSNQLGAYSTVDLNYKDYLYLNLQARNDWFSSLEPQNRSVFYPSASLSFLPSSIFDGLKDIKINYLKLRAAYGTSAGFPSLYLTSNRWGFVQNEYQNGNGSFPGTSYSSLKGNKDLKPELHREFEFGLETKMFNNRLDLNASYYRRKSKNQIVSRDLDPTSGYTDSTINAGQINNNGFEATLSVIPIKSENFNWDITANFFTYKSKVVDLPDGQEKITITGFSNGISNAAIEGEPFNVIVGTYALTDANGNYLINPTNGTLINNDDVGLPNKIIGDPNPDYTLSLNNSFNYKGINLSFMFDFVKGGDFYSNTIENLLRRGVTKDTEEGRYQTYVIPGYYADPNTGTIITDTNGNQIPNNIQISANNVYFLNTVDANSQNIYDATRLRLREVTLGYNFPKKMLKGTGLQNLSINFVGSNLWLKAFNIPKYTNVDPELSSTGQNNGMGLDFQTAPQSRRYGLNLKLNF